MTTRDRLIESAAALFAEKGYDGVSIRDITRAAGANLGAVTYHFGGKEGLFNAMVRRKREPLARILREAVESDLGPREKLEYILTQAGLHIMHTDPALRVLFAKSAQGSRGMPAVIEEGLRQRNRVVGRILRDGIRQGVFRACDVEKTTWMFFGMVMPFMLLEATARPGRGGRPVSRRAVLAVTRQALDIFFGGIEK